MDIVMELIIDDKESWDDSQAEQAGQLFQDILEEQLEMTELRVLHPLLMDLLDTSDIDWHALGQHALDAALAWLLQTRGR